jgi:hypothetical protein
MEDNKPIKISAKEYQYREYMGFDNSGFIIGLPDEDDE